MLRRPKPYEDLVTLRIAGKIGPRKIPIRIYDDLIFQYGLYSVRLYIIVSIPCGDSLRLNWPDRSFGERQLSPLQGDTLTTFELLSDN